jgi:hypothetical protein
MIKDKPKMQEILFPGREEVGKTGGYRVEYEWLKSILVTETRRINKGNNYKMNLQSTLNKEA